MKTTEPTGNRKMLPRAGQFILIYCLCLVALTIVYHKTPITFFRTETGEWLRLAHGPVAPQQELLRGFWTSSSHGHYTPLAFSSEFLFTKWANTDSLRWRARQVSVLALLAAIFFVVVRSAGRALGFSRRSSLCLAFGITTAFICQPLMREMIGWPFHIFQVVWMILTLATLAALLQLLAHPSERKWVWIALLMCYGSLHALGLGIATMLATAAAFSILLLITQRGDWPPFRQTRPTLFAALIALLILGTVHAVCMYLLIGPPRSVLAPTPPFRLPHALGLIAIYPFAVPMNFLGILPSSFPGISLTAESAAPFGILIVCAAGLAGWSLARAALVDGSPLSLSRLVVHAFSVVAWFAFIGLFAMREFYEIGALDMDIYKFFVDARYVLPFSITLLGSLLFLLLPLAKPRETLAAGLAIALGCTAFFAHFYFERKVRPHILANNSISHSQVWQNIAATARECRAAGLPMPDVSVENLITFSPETRLSYFEGILHDALGLPPEERCRFVEWSQSRGPERSQYDAAAPSLRRVIKLLRIDDSVREH